MSYIAGRVGLVPKGEWNATTQYEKLDIVTHNNVGYIAKVDNIPVGTLPTDSNYFLESFAITGYATLEEVEALISTVKNNLIVKNSISMGRRDGKTIGVRSTSLGLDSYASGDDACAIGQRATAQALGAFAAGLGPDATAIGANAFGRLCVANGNYSHAEGDHATASGESSHAEGSYTTASGNYSHASGDHTIAKGNHQTVIGKYNIEDTTRKYAFIIGNGTDDSHRSNALAIKWDGTIVTSDF